MRGPAPHTAEDASPDELRRASLRLSLGLVLLGVLALPLLHELPLGPTGRTGLLAWLLVAVALYWLYAGLGYRPLLLLQLGLFSTAAALLSGKALLVLLGVRQFGILREAARGLVIAGLATALANWGGMLFALYRRRKGPRAA
ncbi:MAG TPA: hypothetical protein VNK43_12955 [Gemmatimonadales bacterium]|nr:hypothetical protein [Gemmatimonadales bacterium]